MTTTRTAPRTTRRTGFGLTDAKAATLVGRIARHRLAEGERVRVAITGKSRVGLYLEGRVIGGPHAGRTVRLGSTLTLERD
jgi:hypothetical protein